MSLNFNGAAKENYTLRWARFVHTSLTATTNDGQRSRIIQKLQNPDTYTRGRYARLDQEKFTNLQTILKNFTKETLPADLSERQEVADSLLLLKERVKTHYYDGCWGYGRWLLSTCFSALCFENSSVGRIIGDLEKRLNCKDPGLKATDKSLREYIHLRGIELPDGVLSSIAEMEESLRAHWLNLPYAEIIQEHKYLPQSEECQEAFQRVLKQSAARHYRTLSFEEMLVVDTPKELRDVYIETFTKKLQEQCQAQPAKLCLSMEGMMFPKSNQLNPYFMVALAKFLETFPKPLDELSLFGPIDDKTLLPLIPVLDKIVLLSLGGKSLTAKGAQQVVNRCKELYIEGLQGPQKVQFFIQGFHPEQFHTEQKEFWSESIPNSKQPLWANHGRQGQCWVVNFSDKKFNADREQKQIADLPQQLSQAAEKTINVHANQPALQHYRKGHSIIKEPEKFDLGLPTTRFGETIDLTDVPEKDKSALWARYVQKALTDDAGSLLGGHEKHLSIYRNNLRPEEFKLALSNTKLKGFKRLNSQELIDLSARLWKTADIEESKARLMLGTKLKTHYYSGFVGSVRWILARLFSKLRFENSQIAKVLDLKSATTHLPPFDPTGKVEQKVLYAYARRAGISLPMGSASTNEEVEIAIRNHCMNLTFAQFVAESMHVPEELMEVYLGHLERSAKGYFATLYPGQLMTLGVLGQPCPEKVRDVLTKCYRETLKDNIKDQITKTQSIYFPAPLGRSDSVNPEFVEILIQCIKEMLIVYLLKLDLSGLKDDMVVKLIPILPRVRELNLGGNHLHISVIMKLIDQVMEWRGQGKTSPISVSYTLKQAENPSQSYQRVWTLQPTELPMIQEKLIWNLYPNHGVFGLYVNDVPNVPRKNPHKVVVIRRHINLLEKRYWADKVKAFKLEQADIKHIEALQAFLKELNVEEPDSDPNALHFLAKLIVAIQQHCPPEKKAQAPVFIQGL